MPKKNTSLAAYDKAFAAAAQEAAGEVAGLGGGSFFSIRGGTLKLGSDAIPNNEMAVIVLDNVFENVFYDSDFDPDDPSGPSCYAFGRKPDDMKPHDDVASPVADGCSGCENNEWGSADTGRGKACKNRVRLACIPGGSFASNGRFEPADADTVSSEQVAYLGIPPTSVGAWASYVKGIASSLKRPPWAVFTKVKLVPDAKTQIALTFELLGPCGPDLAPVLIKRNEDQKEQTAFGYPEVEEKPKKSRRSKSKKKSKKRRRY